MENLIKNIELEANKTQEQYNMCQNQYHENKGVYFLGKLDSYNNFLTYLQELNAILDKYLLIKGCDCSSCSIIKEAKEYLNGKLEE